MAVVDGGWGSGTWAEAAWGCSVYYPVISNAGWGLGAWGSDGWGLGDGGLVRVSDTTESPLNPAIQASIAESAVASDQVLGERTFTGAVTEASVASETVVAGTTIASAVSEQVNVSETVSSLFVINGTFTVTLPPDTASSALIRIN